ncbi:sensor histidine kinase [Kribbella sp.]|uniref:sensor histidine kinase n=1 Tax=Kribbella sp. TaxID=1871183 RepID=UPI002D2BCD7B|nr:sensor histidine kinase [Kribbella sp.]HZX01904.1 sensor histidine kinase [Kribbella sp.]
MATVTAGSTRLGPRSWRLRTQAIVFQAALLTSILLLCLVVSGLVLRSDLEGQYEQRALAVARSVAQQSGLAGLVTTTKPSPTGPVQVAAERVRVATGALYVVVTDDAGIRYSHPTLTEVGQRVSTDPSDALSGREVVAVQEGTLGDSARGKVPLRTPDGRVVGEVSVGISMDDLNLRLRQLVLLLALIMVPVLGLGMLGVVTLARRLRRTTLGLEPEEMADLLREHAAVLGGVRDGVLAIDDRERVTVANDEAVRLTGGGPIVRGRQLDMSGAPEEIVELFRLDQAPTGALRVIDDRVLLVTRLPVRRDGRDLGQVLILRDRSDLDELGRELEATRALTDALRAQAHEYTNRLHSLAGMLHVGHVDQALEYLDDLRVSATRPDGVTDPYLVGLLTAKTAAASEAGVELRTGDSTWVDGRLRRPLDTVTVVANLVDNAIRAAAETTPAQRRPAWVEITLASSGEDLIVHVLDSGSGVPSGADVFGYGVTSRAAADGHGIGLVLARQTARSHGGDVLLVDAGGNEHGAVFTARLPGVISGRTDGGSR